MVYTISKIKSVKLPTYISRPMKRDILAWRLLAGVWKDKKISDVLKWQRKIRKEWDRKLT